MLLPTSFFEACIILISKPEMCQENYRPISLVNQKEKNLQENTSKLNPMMYKKDYTPLQSEIYPIDVRLVQLQCNL